MKITARTFLLFFMALSLPAHSQDEPRTDPLEVTSAVVGAVPTSRNTLAVPKDYFQGGEVIYLSVGTSASNPELLPATLAVNWTYEQRGEVMAVYADGEEITTTGTHRTLFQIEKPDGWPRGRYKAEILVDGKSVRTIGFTVQ